MRGYNVHQLPRRDHLGLLPEFRKMASIPGHQIASERTRNVSEGTSVRDSELKGIPITAAPDFSSTVRPQWRHRCASEFAVWLYRFARELGQVHRRFEGSSKSQQTSRNTG